MPNEMRDYLLKQLDIAWQLTAYHLNDLSTEECLWRPAAVGLHVHQERDGAWRADWPESEGYDLGPASIGWLTWHLCFWWSTVLDASFGAGTLTREAVRWPGSAEAVRTTVTDLHERWRRAVAGLTDDDLKSAERCRWPIQGRPFVEVVGWANLELMKNAAEIGYGRFAFAVKQR